MTPVLRNALVRASRQSATTALGYRAASTTHAISNPTLANIEKRWEVMPMQEQAELWMAPRDRMKESWTELTVQEKKAGKLATPRLQHPSDSSRSDQFHCTAELAGSSRTGPETDCDSFWGAN
jgi:DnaJ-domain-containing protein 1